jgi:phosphohistidine phosphatase SixA
MDLKRMLLIRHAIYDPDDERIKDSGREQVKEIVIPTKKFISQGREDKIKGLGFMSSKKRRAIDTILYLGDQLGGLGELITINALKYGTETSGFFPFYDAIENYDTEMVIAVGHLEFVECFPIFLERKKGWATGNRQERNYCQGYYFDLETKTYRRFPEDI